MVVTPLRVTLSLISLHRFYDSLWDDCFGRSGQFQDEDDIRILVARNRWKEMDQKQVGRQKVYTLTTILLSPLETY